ncbi:hypothetical protein LEN26_000487 [Aphanomyces euteiches]|nr:hypothetical protein AeMF1_002163 [Aphanomyces euteiches]KAH9163495.1 hypothetical protein LEN26_000487 [Aphanomyces euteiches]KAH9191082.1 hypothetical protein AeNC1_006940 [Aphanomyces euteiches]
MGNANTKPDADVRAPSTTTTSLASINDIPLLVHVPLHLDGDTHDAAEMTRLAEDVCVALRAKVAGYEDITTNELVLTHLTGAMTNVIFTCHKKSAPEDKVLLRLYGAGTEAFFSRQEEILVFKELSLLNLGIGLVGEFHNGRFERMIDGRTATAADIRVPDFSEKIAKRMALFHTTQVDIDRQPRILRSIRKFYKDACAAYATSERKFDMEAMARDIEALEELVATVDSPVVFCHNDLQYGNIMVTDDNDAVLIDFEYSHYNPRGYDLGNHFSEWCYNYHGDSPHWGDFAKYPTVAEQRTYCAAYLGENATDDEIDALRREANVYANATHLFWSLWGFIQATQSTIDFDYFGYATCRWEAFTSRVSLQESP